MRALGSLAALVLALVLPAGARAQPLATPADAGGTYYVEANAGTHFPRSSQLARGLSFGARVGGRFHPNVSAEVEVGYFDTSGGYQPSSSYRPVGPVNNEFRVIPLTASVRLRYPTGIVELSAFAGGGPHVVRVSTTNELRGNPVKSSSTETPLGYHVGAEVAFDVSPALRLGLEARRTFVSVDLAPGVMSDHGGSLNLGGVRLAATVGYHF